MQALLKKLISSPLAVRVTPFAVFLALTWAQGQFGEAGRYWFYLAKTMTGAAMIAVTWPHIMELRWAFSWEAAAAGVGVFVIWVGLDGLYPPLDELLAKLGLGGKTTGKSVLPWNPHLQFGEDSALAWLFIIARVAGSVLVVPLLEEVFYRSFLCRYLVNADFLSVPLRAFAWTPFLLTAALFGLTHFEWLAGILCGFIYHGLVIRKGRLGDAMTAHAITNLLLAAWVLVRGAWKFW